MNESDFRKLERRFELLRGAAADLDERLSRIENSLVFRTLRTVGRVWSDARGRAGQALLHSPRLHSLYRRLFPAPPNGYPAWITAKQAAWAVEQPRPEIAVSVLLPVWQPRPEWLRAAIDSVLAQTYSSWQLCICLDGPDSAAAAVVETYARADARIVFAVSPARAGISAALNRAASLATGDYVACLDQDDLLAPAALASIAAAVADSRPGAVYTDEDWCTEAGEPLHPNLKPAWSPELLLSCMYMGHLFAVRRDAGERAGWFRSEFDGAQDYDLALRLDESGTTFHHVPRILYHWRKHAGSTANSAGAKSYAHEAGRRALAASLARRGQRVDTVADGPMPHCYRVRRSVPPGHGVSFIIVTRTPALLERCLRSVAATAGTAPREFIVVHHLTGSAADGEIARNASDFGASVVLWSAPFNFSAMNNLGARSAAHAVLVFLNDDVTAIVPGWQEILLAHALRPEIGIVGAKLVYPSGALQHGGIVVGMREGSGHAGRGHFRSDLWRWLDLPRDVSAVTGACLAVRASVFAELNGFDEDFPVNFNDVDLCLRAQRAGYRVIIEPQATLRHDEARTRTAGTRLLERERFLDRWGDALDDPYYSPLLDRHDERIAMCRG